MPGVEIFGPFTGMMVLTFLVWTLMYARRLNYIFAKRVDAEALKTPRDRDQVIPDSVNWASYNLQNLFELPVLFYALCLFLFVTGKVDSVYVAAAWVFLGFRVAHSAVHCTVNRVRLRFACYAMAAMALWFMLGRAVVALFG